MSQLKLPTVRRIFDELGKGEPLSPCCGATVFQDFSTCINCGNIVAMPFYFISTKPIPDELAIEREAGLRAAFPKGLALVALVDVP